MHERFGPEATARHAMDIFRFLKGSPLGVAGMNNIISGAQQGQNVFNRAIASTGAAGAGVNILRQGFFPSIVGNQVNSLNSNLFSQGLGLTENSFNNLSRGASFPGMPKQQGIENIMRLLGGVGNTNWHPVMSWLKSRFNRRPQAPSPSGNVFIPGQNGFEF